MRAVWYERTGPADEVLVVGEMPTPIPRPGEVRVKLSASGVNPSDCNRRRGAGYSMEYPRVIPNSDGAGIVDLVGEGVPSSLLHQRVWLYNGQRGRPFGTAAEYITLAADLVAPGGLLVFSNCSLDRVEGEDVARAFLAARPDYAVEPVRPDEVPGLEEAVDANGFLRTTPAMLTRDPPEMSGLDGFFAARLRRRG